MELTRNNNNEETQKTPQKHSLDAMFSPASVAVIGATSRPGTVGRTVLENLLRDTFRGKVYPVNAKHEEVLGRKAYKSIRDIPQPVDLAVVATPAATVTQIIAECVEAGAKSAVVISAGFKERGAEGAALEQQIQRAIAAEFIALDWSQLPGNHEPEHRLECHLRQGSAAGRQRRIPESKWSALERHPRLEPSRTSGFQRDRFHRFHAGCRLGRFDLLLWR